MVEPSARFEEFRIPLPDPVHGLGEVSAVLGIPRWWPTGSRVSVVLAHGAIGDHNDPLIEYLHRDLTERRYLCLRFNFPFAEAKKRRPDPPQTLRRAFRAAVGALSRDPTAARPTSSWPARAWAPRRRQTSPFPACARTA